MKKWVKVLTHQETINEETGLLAASDYSEYGES
jgi:hypothetical protein